MASYDEMMNKMRRDGMAEQKAKFMSTAGTPAMTSMRYGSMTDAEEQAASAKAKAASPAPEAAPAAAPAPKARVRGVPSEMTAEGYAPIKSAAPEGKTQRTVPVGPQPVVEDKPDMFPAYGYEAPLTKMFLDNGMSEADATQVAKNIVEIYKQSGDKSTGQLMRHVADTQTKSKFTPEERARNLMIAGMIAGAGVGAGSLGHLIGAFPGAIGGEFTGIVAGDALNYGKKR